MQQPVRVFHFSLASRLYSKFVYDNRWQHKRITVFFRTSMKAVGAGGALAGEPQLAVVLLVIDHVRYGVEHLFAVAADQGVRCV